jgi:tRNA(fMet)-specific endonuclease VapC
MYLLDTDTVIYSLNDHSIIKENLRLHLYDPLMISVITLMELYYVYYGAHKSKKTTSNLAKIRAIENSLEIVVVGRESVEIFGTLKANLEIIGAPLDDFDLVLASCALANNLILVTNNLKHFERIQGLKVENWTQKG